MIVTLFQTYCLFYEYFNSSKRITISESPQEDSFLSIVLGSLHTGVMNFITSDDIYCLYPTLMPSVKTCFCGVQGPTDFASVKPSGQGGLTWSLHQPFLQDPVMIFVLYLCGNFMDYNVLVCFIGMDLAFQILMISCTLGDLCTKDDCSTWAHAKLLNFSF